MPEPTLDNQQRYDTFLDVEHFDPLLAQRRFLAANTTMHTRLSCNYDNVARSLAQRLKKQSASSLLSPAVDQAITQSTDLEENLAKKLFRITSHLEKSRVTINEEKHNIRPETAFGFITYVDDFMMTAPSEAYLLILVAAL